MSLARLLNQAFYVFQRDTTQTDEYGNASETSFAGVTSGGDYTIFYGFLEQKDTVETLLDRDTIVSSWTLHATVDAPITALDYIALVDDPTKKFQVDGEPWTVYNPRTRSNSHIQAKLKVVP
jgi:hypothetical protein